MARINLGNGRIRRDGRFHQHHHGGIRIRRVMPRRPRKPPTAFNLFIRAFYRSPMSRNFRGTADAMRYAGQFWRSNPDIHAEYERMQGDSRIAFHRNLEVYNRRMQVVRRPGNGYIIFARELWQLDRGNRSVREFGRYAGQLWRSMSADERRVFVTRAENAREDHSRMLDNIHLGNTRIDDYLVTPPRPAPGQTGNQTGNAASPN